MLRLRVLPGRHAQKSSGVEVGVYKVEYDAHAMDSPCDKTSTFNLINLATDVFPILGLSSSEVDGPWIPRRARLYYKKWRVSTFKCYLLKTK